MISRCLRFGLELIEQRVEALVVPFPQPAVPFQPPGRLAEPLRLEAARPPLRVTAARNQAGALQHLQVLGDRRLAQDRKSTRLNSSHGYISYAVFCLKKKKEYQIQLSALRCCLAAWLHPN